MHVFRASGEGQADAEAGEIDLGGVGEAIAIVKAHMS